LPSWTPVTARRARARDACSADKGFRATLAIRQHAWAALLLACSAAAQPAPSRAQTPASAGDFVDVTATSGVTFHYQSSHTSRKYLLETMGAGVALFDYDNDGRLDLFLVNGAPLADPTPRGTVPRKTGPRDWDRLYHQRPDGTFEDVTDKAGLQGATYGMGVAVGDYDNDGYEDLYVTAYGGNTLYHNNGDGTFTDVTKKAGVRGSGWSTSAAWVDLDNDGLLDLVVLRYVQWDFDDVWCGEHKPGHRAYCHPDIFPAIAPLVFHNEGNGHFREVAQKSGLAKPAKALGIALADYDRDGRIDLFIANDSIPEFLYHNQGGGTFNEVGLASQAALDDDGAVYAGMGVDFADYDNDGWPDLVVTDLAHQRYALYRNNRDGTFSYASFASGLARMSQTHSGWGVRFMDYDNDGWKDLLVAQGHDLDTVELTAFDVHYREPMMLARNQGRTFTDVSAQSGGAFQNAWVARGMAVGDIDNDGRLDAVVTTNDGPVHILMNRTATRNHWLTLALVGHTSNRDGIGAVVEIATGHARQFATVSTAGSYLSASDKRVHFGLGSDALVRALEVRWPSGIVQKLTDVRADQILRLDEPPRVVELYGSALVMNTYLKIALVLTSLVAAGLLALNFLTAARAAALKPVVIRIDEVGRAEAVAYDATAYKPQAPELRYFLTRFVVLHFSRLRATIQRDYPDSLFFLDSRLADATIAHNEQSRVIETFLTNPSGDETDIDVKNVTFTELTKPSYKASVDFEQRFFAPGTRQERKRETDVAQLDFLREAVPNAFIRVNPLGRDPDHVRPRRPGLRGAPPMIRNTAFAAALTTFLLAPGWRAS
jgi:enediyne biosynthesis protein E4